MAQFVTNVMWVVDKDSQSTEMNELLVNMGRASVALFYIIKECPWR